MHTGVYNDGSTIGDRSMRTDCSIPLLNTMKKSGIRPLAGICHFGLPNTTVRFSLNSSHSIFKPSSDSFNKIQFVRSVLLMIMSENCCYVFYFNIYIDWIWPITAQVPVQSNYIF